MKYLANVTTLNYDRAKCTGCRRCTEVCPHGVFEMRDGVAAVTDRDRCIECGACAANCAFGAITVDAGVGCAAAMINGILRFGDPDKGSCDCADADGCC
ncbi:MAG: 4Fe-4S dicluster domain-containing protein [Chitinivibrionales bacterium]|nr:4Fe-4S dicluster domain-containing protein [Chitinivibrionales bacterium]